MSGRKRHILVDTLGLLLAVVVHPASVQDRDGAKLVLAKAALRLSRLRLIWVDHGYAGALVEWVQQQFGWVLEVVQHACRAAEGVFVPLGTKPPPQPAVFAVLPRRWVVERTLAWLGLHRRLSKDYEGLPETEEAWVQIAMIRLMLRRLGHAP